MREIISVLIDTKAPLATSKRLPQINAEDREQLLNTFTRTVFSTRPPIDIAYRCMRLDLWTWTEQALGSMEHDQVTIDDMLQQYLDTMKASRNAERLYHLWRGSHQQQYPAGISAGGCGGAASADTCPNVELGMENFVVTQKPPRDRSGDDARPHPIDNLEQRIRSYTSPLEATLQDWFYVGMATEDAQHQCRITLCRKVAAFCGSATATMRELIHNQDRMKAVADVILVHGASPSTNAALIPGAVRKAKTGADAGLDVYRNFFEAPLMNILSTAFSTPAFFGWVDATSVTLREKRDTALAVLQFAKATLHPTSVEPLLKLYISSVFTSPVDCLGSDQDVAARLSAAATCCGGDSPHVAEVSLDSVALTCFTAKARLDGYVSYQKAMVIMAQRTGISYDIAPLFSSLTVLFSLPVFQSSFTVEALKRLNAAHQVVASTWGKQLIDFLIQAVHQERVDDELMHHSHCSNVSSAVVQLPSTKLQQLWDVVKCGVSMDRFEPCYVNRLIQRCLASAASLRAADAEATFAELFFPASSCPLQFAHRVRKLVADLKSSTQLTVHCAVVMAGGDSVVPPPPNSLCVMSRIVAQEYLDKVTLPLLPKCLQPTLTVAGLVYCSQYQPTRSVSWLAYKSQVTIAHRRPRSHPPTITTLSNNNNSTSHHHGEVGGAKLLRQPPHEYTMSLAHLSVIEAVEEYYDDEHHHRNNHNNSPHPPTIASLAEKLGVNSHHMQVLVEDLVEAGGLLRTTQHQGGMSMDAVIDFVEDAEPPSSLFTETAAAAAANHIDVLLISSRRVARLRKRQQERCRPALESALMRLLKHSDTPLLLDSNALIPPLLPLLPPVGFVVDPHEVEQAVLRLISRQYLAVDTSTNLVSYLV